MFQKHHPKLQKQTQRWHETANSEIFWQDCGLFRVKKPNSVWVIIIQVRRISTGREEQGLTTVYRLIFFVHEKERVMVIVSSATGKYPRLKYPRQEQNIRKYPRQDQNTRDKIQNCFLDSVARRRRRQKRIISSKVNSRSGLRWEFWNHFPSALWKYPRQKYPRRRQDLKKYPRRLACLGYFTRDKDTMVMVLGSIWILFRLFLPKS